VFLTPFLEHILSRSVVVDLNIARNPVVDDDTISLMLTNQGPITSYDYPHPQTEPARV
jgi:hypothetical protein